MGRVHPMYFVIQENYYYKLQLTKEISIQKIRQKILLCLFLKINIQHAIVEVELQNCDNKEPTNLGCDFPLRNLMKYNITYYTLFFLCYRFCTLRFIIEQRYHFYAVTLSALGINLFCVLTTTWVQKRGFFVNNQG